MTDHLTCNKSKSTGGNSEAGTAYHFGAPEFTYGFNGVRFAQNENIHY